MKWAEQRCANVFLSALVAGWLEEAFPITIWTDLSRYFSKDSGPKAVSMALINDHEKSTVQISGTVFTLWP